MVHASSRRAIEVVLALAVVLFVMTPITALADPNPPTIRGGMQNNDIRTIGGMRSGDLLRLSGTMPGAVGIPAEYSGPWFQYGSTGMCAVGGPGTPGVDNACGNDPCIRNAALEAQGPAVRVWQREVDAQNQPIPGAAWQAIDEHGDGVSILPAKDLNRLSDLLFILSRVANPDGDVLWQPAAGRGNGQTAEGS